MGVAFAGQLSTRIESKFDVEPTTLSISSPTRNMHGHSSPILCPVSNGPKPKMDSSKLNIFKWWTLAKVRIIFIIPTTAPINYERHIAN